MDTKHCSFKSLFYICPQKLVCVTLRAARTGTHLKLSLGVFYFRSRVFSSRLHNSIIHASLSLRVYIFQKEFFGHVVQTEIQQNTLSRFRRHLLPLGVLASSLRVFPRLREERERHIIPFVDGILIIMPFLWRRKERKGCTIPFVAKKCAAVGVR